VRGLLELGGGQGRDTLFFAQSGFEVDVLDYVESAVEMIQSKAQAAGFSERIRALHHDVRQAGRAARARSRRAAASHPG
jgi:tRNA1(Val) A37 N6-methylase TrmN6